jgi:hypothetical protein
VKRTCSVTTTAAAATTTTHDTKRTHTPPLPSDTRPLFSSLEFFGFFARCRQKQNFTKNRIALQCLIPVSFILLTLLITRVPFVSFELLRCTLVNHARPSHCAVFRDAMMLWLLYSKCTSGFVQFCEI